MHLDDSKIFAEYACIENLTHTIDAHACAQEVQNAVQHSRYCDGNLLNIVAFTRKPHFLFGQSEDNFGHRHYLAGGFRFVWKSRKVKDVARKGPEG